MRSLNIYEIRSSTIDDSTSKRNMSPFWKRMRWNMIPNIYGIELCRRFQRLRCCGTSPTVCTVGYKYYVGFADSANELLRSFRLDNMADRSGRFRNCCDRTSNLLN